MGNSYGPKSTVADGLVFVCDPGNPLCYTSGSATVETLYSDNLTGGPVSGSLGGDCFWDVNEKVWVNDGTSDYVEINLSHVQDKL